MEPVILAFNGTYNFDFRAGRHLDMTQHLAARGLPDARYLPVPLARENSFSHLDVIFDQMGSGRDVVVLCGTDNIEELAFLFALNRPAGQRVFFLGSMFPLGHPQYDGEASIESLLRLRSVAGEGSWVVVGDCVARGETVRKVHSTDAKALQPSFPVTNRDRCAESSRAHFSIRPSALTARVPVLMVSLGDTGEWLDWENVDALVLAGSGTGSIPRLLRERLGELRGSRRIVVTTRCMAGPNHDGELYPGSAEAYEEQGFEVKAFSLLNPFQARIRLMLELASDAQKSEG